MTRKETKQKRDAIPVKTLAEIDAEQGVTENYDHLLDPLDRYLEAEQKKKENK